MKIGLDYYALGNTDYVSSNSFNPRNKNYLVISLNKIY